jgi:hypothetical protein
VRRVESDIELKALLGDTLGRPDPAPDPWHGFGDFERKAGAIADLPPSVGALAGASRRNWSTDSRWAVQLDAVEAGPCAFSAPFQIARLDNSLLKSLRVTIIGPRQVKTSPSAVTAEGATGNAPL